MLWIGIAGTLLIVTSAVLGWRLRTSGTAAKIIAFVLGIVGVLLVFVAVWSTDDFRFEDTGGEPSTTPTPAATRVP